MFMHTNIRLARTASILGLLLLLLSIVLGCSPQVKKSPQGLTSIEKTTYPLIMRDDSGADVIIEHKPLKIISLLPSSTEILFALGQEEHIIGVTKWDNYPQGIQQRGYYAFEDALNPNLEKIIDLRPDLVLIGSVSGDTLRKMRSLNIPVFVLNPQSIEKTYETIRKIGYLTDRQKRSLSLIDSMQEKEKKIKEVISQIDVTQKNRVWLEVSSDLYAPGRNTFLHELITKAGGKSISSDLEGWGQFNPAQIITKDPQVIFFTYGQFEKNAQENIKHRSGWQNIDAVKNNRIYELDNDLISRPGPRIIEGLELIAKYLYPDKF